jgi:hypothetical protein
MACRGKPPFTTLKKSACIPKMRCDHPYRTPCSRQIPFRAFAQFIVAPAHNSPHGEQKELAAAAIEIHWSQLP